MEATLTKSELDAISTMVSEKLYAKFIAEGSQKELQTATEVYTKKVIRYYLDENAISYDVQKMIKPILDEHLKETKVVEEHLRSYMNTDHFKKMEIKHLRSRINQIERELEEEFDNF